MAFCSRCGAQVPDDAAFCTNCGNALKGGPQATHNTASQAGETFKRVFVNTADTSGEFDPTDIANNKAMAILSYLGPLVFVPYFAAKTSKFAQYHAKQGMNVFCLWVIYAIVSVLLSLIKVTRYVWGIPIRETSGVVVAIIVILGICVAALAILGIVNAAMGKAKELPLIGRIHIF